MGWRAGGGRGRPFPVSRLVPGVSSPVSLCVPRRRAAACSAQNRELRRKVQELEQLNGSLLRQLRALLKPTSEKAAQTSACALILVLSLGLILFPSSSPFRRDTGSNRPIGVISRNILTQDAAGEAAFPVLGMEEPGPAGDGADGEPPLSSNSSSQAPTGDMETGIQGHGDEM